MVVPVFENKWPQLLAFIQRTYVAQLRKQRDQIGQFLKVLGDKISNKSIPSYYQLFGLFWKTILLCKNLFGHFLGDFWKHLGNFYSNIWSRWSKVRERARRHTHTRIEIKKFGLNELFSFLLLSVADCKMTFSTVVVVSNYLDGRQACCYYTNGAMC